MLLEQLKYSQYANQASEWILNPVDFERISLVVGLNSSGKTKTLNVIENTAKVLSDNLPISYGEGVKEFMFKKDETKFNYKLEFHKNIITNESLVIGGEDKIRRNDEGKGVIKGQKGDYSFEMPLNELVATRRDKTNYPYLEEINNWAKHVRRFNFGNTLGKNSIIIKDPSKPPTEYSLKNTDGVLVTFSCGVKEFPNDFKKNVIADFNSIGYDIEDILLGTQENQILSIPELGAEAESIAVIKVKERSLNCFTDQWEMSSGMFRALSLIIHFNYYQLKGIPGLVLVDDIGEGLDFERSTNLIKLLISKVESNTELQIIMTTNDYFVMNEVDLKYWQIIDREGPKIKYYNYKNSGKTFDDYKFTGLNHFDFFKTGFYKSGFEICE